MPDPVLTLATAWTERGPERRASDKHFQAMLLDDHKELDGHAAGPFDTSLPLLDRGLAGIQVAGKDWLTDLLALPDLFDLSRFD